MDRSADNRDETHAIFTDTGKLSPSSCAKELPPHLSGPRSSKSGHDHHDLCLAILELGFLLKTAACIQKKASCDAHVMDQRLVGWSGDANT